MPLLPNGPVYLGFSPFGYIELALVPLFALWLAGRHEARGRQPAPWPVPLWPWHLLLAVTLGSALVGLLAEHRLDSPVFAAMLRQHGGDLLGPIDQAAHPLQPVRVALTVLEGWVVFVLVADLCRRAPDPDVRSRFALAGWLAGAAVVSGLAVIQYLTRYQLHPYWVKANPHIVRSHATLDDPNALGAYLVLGIGLSIGWLYLASTRRRVAWALCLLLTAGMMTTMSRAAIGGAALGTVLVLALVPAAVTRRQQLVRTGGRLALAALLALVMVSAAFRVLTTERTRTQPTSEAELVLKTFDPRESTDWVLRGRLAWWKAAAGMFIDHPVTGVGLGRYPRLLAEYGGGRSRENAHNLLLQFLAEAGLPGGLAFGTFAAMLCLAFFRAVRDAAEARTRAVALGGAVGVAAFLLTLVTGHMLLLPSGQVLFASFVATAAALAGSKRMTAGSSRMWVPLLAVCAVVVFSYPAVALARGIGPRVGAWGYAAGLFPEERTGDGASYRWTGAEALLDLNIPAGATTLVLPVAAPAPMRNGTPTRIWISAGEWVHARTLSTADLQTVRVPLDRGREDGPGRILVRVRVEPPFTPAEADPSSNDRRRLGVQILSPRFTP